MWRTVIGILMAVVSAFACQAQTLLAMQDEWPPYVMKGDRRGLAVEIVAHAYASQGYDIDLKFVPWSRVLFEARRNKLDIIIGAWHSDERAQYLMFSDPYFTNSLIFFKRKGDPYEFDGLTSLAGKKVGTMRGYTYTRDFELARYFTREPVGNMASNLYKLLAGRIDLIVGDPVVIDYTAHQYAIDMKLLDWSEKALRKTDLYVAVSKENPNARELLAVFNRGLAAIKENGTYDRVLEDYHATRYSVAGQSYYLGALLMSWLRI